MCSRQELPAPGRAGSRNPIRSTWQDVLLIRLRRRELPIASTRLTVSVPTARRFILGCQGLWPGRRWTGRSGTRKALHQVGLVQIDPLNVVGRSHDLALHARVWDCSPAHLDHVLYTSREFFDYGGTLYVLPMAELPYWRVHMARRAVEERSRTFAAEHGRLLEALRADVASRGPVASRDFTGRKSRGTFRSDKDAARALRHLWLTGELMTYGRRRFERLYALRSDVAPVDVRQAATEDEADAFFARKALALLGLATAREWAQRFRHLARRRGRVLQGSVADWTSSLTQAGRYERRSAMGPRTTCLASGPNS